MQMILKLLFMPFWSCFGADLGPLTNALESNVWGSFLDPLVGKLWRSKGTQIYVQIETFVQRTDQAKSIVNSSKISIFPSKTGSLMLHLFWDPFLVHIGLILGAIWNPKP